VTRVITAADSADGSARRYRIECPDDIPSRYLAGESEYSIAKVEGVSRGTVTRWLQEAGIQKRGMSAAGKMRASLMTREERVQQVAAANAAVRGSAKSDIMKIRTILGRQKAAMDGTWHRSQGETALGQFFGDQGVKFVPEQAVAGYNVDFGIEPVAVELLGGSWHAAPSRVLFHRQRSEAIFNAGWSLIFIWSTSYYPANRFGYEKVVELVDELSADPAPRGQYRVIRGDGDLVASGGKGDDFTLVYPGGGCYRGRP